VENRRGHRGKRDCWTCDVSPRSRCTLGLDSDKGSLRRIYGEPLVENYARCTYVIVTAVFASPDDREFEPSGLMGVGDARALTALEAWFKSIRFKDYEIRYSHDTSGEALSGSNLICVGGPDANSITKDALRRLESITDILKRPDVPSAAFHDEGEGLDYAVVCFVPSPYSDEKRILFLFGAISGYGTWAAAEAVTIKPIAMSRFGEGGFSAFLRTEIVRKHPQQVSLSDFRPIAARSSGRQ
jgi:hypothetical protein